MTTEADNNSEETANEVCAHCGKAAVDEIKLKKCACNLVKYCTVDCQKNHRPQHKKACKKRLTEIRDDRLFTQPDESHLGECPLCCLPLPLDPKKYGTFSCCCKRICRGCSHANQQREIEQGLEQRCPFCREPMPRTDKERNDSELHEKNLAKRVKTDDPIALLKMGVRCDEERDYEGAIEYYTKAAGLGEMDAHFNLSLMYYKGEGVEKDGKKKVYHLEEAAIGGHAGARNNLGCHEEDSGQINRAMKHYIIAANLGHGGASEAVKMGFAHGVVSKEDFEAALRGHQAAVDATKSKQRDEAYECFQQFSN